ncbi:MAG TPA: hypothetical protein VLU47_08595 [Blastocatellia bacterium]|nr:hypothetical protein [Blastocatellia bacterium]
MYAGNETRIAAAGEVFERDFIGECEVVVRREGHSRARHTFSVGGRIIARLRWRGLRRAVYEAEGVRFDINVWALQRRISIISEDGSESWLRERSRANPNRAGLRVEMAEGDNFRLLRSGDSRLRSQVSIRVQKQFYSSTLLVFQFDKRHRTQTTTRIKVNAVMKWEARFTHRLLALIVSRIILERRHSGAPPLKIKEEPRRFAGAASVYSSRRLY